MSRQSSSLSYAPPTLPQRLAERAAPSSAIVMHQRWENLLFLHWRCAAAEVQRTLPAGLTVDTAEGVAWVGLVPLFMRNVRPRFTPAIPALSDFLELNLRTYVYDAMGRPGVYFYSLDCNQPLAVEGARRLLHLRYEHSRMTGRVDAEGNVHLTSAREGRLIESDQFHYRISPLLGREVPPESLEFFLIERYRLFTDRGPGHRLWSVRVHHAPYRVRSADVFQWGTSALRLAGFDTHGRAPDHVCAAEPVDLQVHMPEMVGVE